MGKPVGFRRGIATVIPDCASGTVSQDTSLRGFFNRLRDTDFEARHMSYTPSPLRGSSRSAIALFALLATAPTHAEEPAKPIDPLIVSAMRVPREASTVTSAVTVLDPQELQNQGLFQLRDALNASPGVISTSTSGQTGAIGNLFIRGTTLAESLVVIDGVQFSSASGNVAALLAATRVYDVGTIEVLRGPQAAVYGGQSMGGVLWMETPHGSESPHGATTLEAGAFSSLSAQSMFQGQSGDVSYYLSGGYEETDNDAPKNSFHQGNTALRVEGKVDPVWTIGTTFRAVDSYYENRGSSDDYLDTALSTLYATGKISETWTARFNAGYYQEFYDSDSTLGGGYGADLRAESFSTDHEVTLAENLRLLAGGFYHHDSYESEANYFGYNNQTDVESDRYGVHTALEWDPVENLTTTAAVRWEDYDSYGDEFTWRLGSIYHFDESGTSLRGGIGSAFRAPSYVDLYYYSESVYNGTTTVTQGNPDLNSQSSIGWDLGVEQKIGEHNTIEATWFRNLIDDAINPNSFPMPTNLPGTTTTDGLELGLRGDWLENTLSYRAAWTYLHESLKDQPRNAVTASVDWKPTDKSLVGIGATHLSEHSWGGNPIDSYIIARLYGSYQVTDKVKLHVRLENALDEDYELGNFGAAPYNDVIKGSGTALYAGITVDW